MQPLTVTVYMATSEQTVLTRNVVVTTEINGFPWSQPHFLHSDSHITLWVGTVCGCIEYVGLKWVGKVCG